LRVRALREARTGATAEPVGRAALITVLSARAGSARDLIAARLDRRGAAAFV